MSIAMSFKQTLILFTFRVIVGSFLILSWLLASDLLPRWELLPFLVYHIPSAVVNEQL